jgi:carboxymethylenebutenolidase
MTQSTETNASSSDGLLTRRDFAVLSVAAGLTAAAGTAGAAVAAVGERAVEIRTEDGTCDAVFVHPKSGPAPAVIMYPDAFGLRPVKVEMARRLAGEGYAVLVFNQFYRVRKAPVLPPTFSVSNPDDRAMMMKMIGALDQAAITRDTRAFMAFLDAQPEVNAKARMGAVGYCMGGKMTIWAASYAPDRFAAAASFHGGGLVTDKPDSPHTLIPTTKASYHIGISTDDDAKEPESKTVLKATLQSAGRPATVEVYPGANHGWTVPDSAVYDQPQAERAWAAMTALYKQALV